MLSILNESDFQVDNGLFVIKFWATWCGPCKRLEPSLQKMEQEFGENVKFLSIDVDKFPTITQKFRVRTLPTILLVKNGIEANRVSGVVLVEPLRKVFRDFLKDFKSLDDF